MTTFSQLVDRAVAETRRKDLRTEIETYLQQTIREVHFEPQRNDIVYYDENRTEALITAASESLTWDVPDPTRFQLMEAVEYGSVTSRLGERVFATKRSPGRGSQSRDYWYYRAGGTFVFSGFGSTGATVKLSFFQFPRTLVYYADADRPATFDIETGTWTYEDSFDMDETTREQARDLTTNWLIMRWSTVLLEGLRAKVFKRLSDTERSRTSYSLYASLRQGLYTSEASQDGVYL